MLLESGLIAASALDKNATNSHDTFDQAWTHVDVGSLDLKHVKRNCDNSTAVGVPRAEKQGARWRRDGRRDVAANDWGRRGVNG